MAYHKNATLKVERFSKAEETELRIDSTAEMVSILKNIADQGTHVALHYDNERSFILTIVLDADEDGMWLDVGPSPGENEQLLHSDRITFVSVHQHVKIQFDANQARNDSYHGSTAFFMELPDYLLRIQRREFFRVDIPVTMPVICTIHTPPQEPGDPPARRTVPVLDISGGGVGLLCEEHEAILLPGRVFPDCRIALPGVGSLAVALEVRNNVSFTSARNAVHVRAGCSFVRLDNQASLQLQGYVTRLQQETLVNP